MTPTPTPIPISTILSPSDPLIILLVNVIKALVILAIALGLAGLGRRWAVGLLTRSRVGITQANLVGNIAQAVIVVLGILAIMPVLGIEWSGLLTVLGASGLALALSLQDLLRNVVAGLYVLIEQPFKIGDKITVKDSTGKVQSIQLRTTILLTEEGLQVIVPNSVILTEVVTNRSAYNLQRETIKVRIARGSITGASQQILEILNSFEEVAATPAPVVALEEVSDAGALLRVQFWVPATQRIAIAPRVVEALQTRFHDATVTVS